MWVRGTLDIKRRGEGVRVKTVSPFQPKFTFTHTGSHLQFQLEVCDIRNVLITKRKLFSFNPITPSPTYIATLLFRVLI